MPLPAKHAIKSKLQVYRTVLYTVGTVRVAAFQIKINIYGIYFVKLHCQKAHSAEHLQNRLKN